MVVATGSNAFIASEILEMFSVRRHFTHIISSSEVRRGKPAPDIFLEAARRMNIPFQRLNAIVRGRRGVSADTALLFEALTQWDAEIWLTLQAKWDLWHALKARGARPRVRPLAQSA